MNDSKSERIISIKEEIEGCKLAIKMHEDFGVDLVNDPKIEIEILERELEELEGGDGKQD